MFLAPPNVAAQAQRAAGELSLWKGAATGYATRNGLFGALLGAEGMTGPDRPFEGRHGLWDLITGPFELEPFGGRGGPFRTPEVQLKYWPVEYNAQLVVWAALELRGRVSPEQIASIDVGTYAFTVSEIGSDPEKWDPLTRETADHSLPYILARTLVAGTMDLAAFEEPAYRDPALRPLMQKITVRKDEAIQAIYPEVVAIKLDVATTSGERFVLDLRDPLGHTRHPMGDEDINAKFLGVAEAVLGPDRARAALSRWWGLEHLTDLAEALSLLEVRS